MVQSITIFLKNNAGHLAAITVIMSGALIVSGMWATIQSPYTGEIIGNYLIRFAFCLIAILAGIAGGYIIHGIIKSAVEVRPDMVPPLSLREQFSSVFGVELPAAPMQLPASAASVYDVRPNVIIVRENGENDDQYQSRLSVAAKAATRNSWVVAINYRSPIVTIFDSESPRVYQRDEPIFILPEWPDYEGRLCQSGVTFTAETPAQYQAYCADFCRIFREWAPRKKPHLYRDGMRTDAALSLMRSAFVFFLLLFSVILSAQTKTEQVVSAFGGTGGVPEPGAGIAFQFDNGDIVRTADGRRNYVELLKSVPGFQDNGGRLIAVWNGTRSVARANDIERVNARPASKAEQMRPVSVIIPTEQQLSQLAMPDSSEIDESIRHEFDYRKTQIWQAVAPYWKIGMWIFWSLLPIPLFIIRVLRYYAKTAKNERFYGLSGIGRFIHRIHESCSGYILLICWGLAGFLFLDLFMVFVYWGISLWGWLFTVFPLSWMAEKLTNWVTPNPPTAMQVEQGSGKSYYPAGR